MNSLLCDEELRKFFGILSKCTSSQADFDRVVRENIQPVAKKLGLARAELEYYAPKSQLVPLGAKGNIGIFGIEEDVNYDCSVRMEFTIFETGKSVCTFYAVAGKEWSEQEKEDVKLLGQMLFITGGNSRLIELIKKAVVTDSKTGLPNSDAFNAYGAKLVNEKKMVGYSAGFVNIKNFRYMNQKMGSNKSDEIIKKLGRTIQRYLTEGEIIARLGGDNFAVLVKNERLDGFTEYISKISVPINNGDGISNLDIAVRAGFYSAVENDSIDDIMNASSVALNVARSKGTSDFVKLDPYMIKRIMQEKEISSIFPKALEDMEFSVFYQPKVNLENSSVCGGEALVRWIKNGEIIPPGQFIPVLEREGKVCSVDFYVLETVCRDIRKWIDMGIEPVRISVNFSKLNLYNRNLTEEILAIMNKYGVTSDHIEIELTEMSGYEDYEALCIFIANMKELGIKTSIDDFGTGYSSFNLIKDLNADIIKLDRSFLTHIDNKYEKQCRTDEIVIKNIVNMVNELEMEVIAEGVETIAQAEFLKKINCLKVQGFLFDKPLPIEEFEKILSTKKVYSVIAG